MELPPLIELPVYRETYLSQERTDELCRYVWTHYPKHIWRITEDTRNDELERGEIPNVMRSLSGAVRNDGNAGTIEPTSMTARVDLMHEIDRRIHRALGLPEIAVIKYPIASSPAGPFPPLIDIPILRTASGLVRCGMTQERADRLTRVLYEKLKEENPEVIFASVELMRMGLLNGEPTWVMSVVADKVAIHEEGIFGSDVKLELLRRLLKMVAAPPTIETARSRAHGGTQ